MANQRLCSIQGCGKRHFGRGYCHCHYERLLRHGSPFAGRAGSGNVRKFLENVVLPYDGHECLIWPFPIKTRYPGFRNYEGRQCSFHRYICSIENGPPPTEKHEAAHSCGNSHCVNKTHLSWKTGAQNAADKLVHGTDMRGEKHFAAKLTASQVREMRALKGKHSLRELGRMFNIHHSVVGRIFRGEAWPDVL